MQRYFLEKTESLERPIVLPPEVCHHLVTVLRAQVGSKAEFVFPDRTVFIGQVSTIENKQVTVKFVEQINNDSQLPIQIIIACGLPKGEKTQLITQKATELGVHQIIFFESERSVSRWASNKVVRKIERLQTIAKNASEQSHRSDIPTVTYLPNLDDVLKLDANQKVVAWEEAAKQGEQAKLAQVFNTMKAQQILLAIFGPEGGLSETEVKRMQAQNVIAAGLGPRILRTETAPLYLLAAASYHFELERK